VTDVHAVRAVAPGRVNLIGEHTDYTGGLAFPMAIQLGITLEGTLGGGRLRLRSDLAPDALDLPLPLPALDAVPEFWRIATAAAARGGVERAGVWGLDGRLSSTLPAGSGLSSSAATEAAVALAVGATGSPIELARLCQAAEHDAGVPCGLLDQLAVLGGRRGHGLLIDFATSTAELRPISDRARIAVVPSGEERDLARTPYPRRVAEAQTAAKIVDLRGDPAEVEALDDPVLRRRARHIATENRRVTAFAEAVAADDLAAAGQLMDASHASLRDDFEVSTPTLDALVADLRAVRGVHGARLTGAGFGGCVVALVPHDLVDKVRQAVTAQYKAESGLEASIYVCHASPGAGLCN